MSLLRYAVLPLVACLWPALAPATSPYDVVPLPSGEISGVGVAECGVFNGGLHAGASCEFALDAGLRLHGDKRLGWRGSSLVADLEAVGGGRPTLDYVGDAQGVSNIEAPWALRLYEIYFSQTFTVTGSQLRFGLIEISDQFMFVPGTAELINSSFGLVPTLSLNVPTSTFPKPGWGVTLEQRFGKHWRARAGLFQGQPEHRARPFSGGAMAIGEIEYGVENGAMISLGTWRYSRPGGDGYGNPRHDWGAQLGTSLPLYGGRLRVFGQVGIAPERQSFSPYYAEAGLRWAGPLPGRRRDALAIALGRDWIRGTHGLKAETVPELIYSAQILPGVYLQPDLQYVSRPLAGGIAHTDALVGLLRIYATIQ
ncbi:MAG: carbohydrate porin [Gammaproteobacteria bacterium]|nr:carbohydrate porin [Gammaproteobacteria bacterium]